MRTFGLILCLFCLASRPVAAQTNWDVRAEQIRAECIKNRRYICGRVLQIVPGGLIVDSGYTSLLRQPLDRSWVTRATVTPTRPDPLLEGTEPDSPAVGLVFLTDFPKRPAVHQYDYVTLHGYQAGQYNYEPLHGVKKTIRRFSGGLETAVRLNIQSARAAAGATVASEAKTAKGS